MISLEQTLNEQENIEELCKPKLENRFEVYSPNDNYGFAYILKTYANYPIEEPIYATFPHGPYLRDRVIPKSELEVELPAHLNYPPYTTDLWKKATKKKKVIPAAAPIHYALKLFSPEVKPDQRKGTLFMPKHSTQVVSVSFDKQAVIQELKSLPEEFHPITVCVHWQDVEKGLHTFFKSNGFNVVSAGHLTDYQYMFRWLHLVSQYKLISHCGLGSALFYSILADHPFFLTKEDAKTDSNPNFQLFHKNIPHYSSAANKRMENLRELFGKPLSEITAEQKSVVNYYTYADLVKSPEALNKQLKSLKAMAHK